MCALLHFHLFNSAAVEAALCSITANDALHLSALRAKGRLKNYPRLGGEIYICKKSLRERFIEEISSHNYE